MWRADHVALPDAARLRLRTGPDHRHRRFRQSQAGHARADRREGGRQDHGQDETGQRPAARQARDQRPQEPVAPEHLQAVPGNRDGDALLRGHGVLFGRRAVRPHRREEPSQRNGVQDVLQTDHIGRVVPARARLRPPRPQAGERAPGQGAELENHRFRPVRQTAGRHGELALDLLRLANVRRSRTHPGSQVPRVRGGHLEHGRYTLRAVVRLSAF